MERSLTGACAKRISRTRKPTFGGAQGESPRATHGTGRLHCACLLITLAICFCSACNRNDRLPNYPHAVTVHFIWDNGLKKLTVDNSGEPAPRDFSEAMAAELTPVVHEIIANSQLQRAQGTAEVSVTGSTHPLMVRVISYQITEPNIDALMRAAAAGQTDQCLTMLARGHSVNEKDQDGLSGLYWAVYERHLETAQTLLKAGANPDSADANGFAPLHIAATYGDSTMLQSLTTYHAKVNVRNKFGQTSIELAVKARSLESVTVLLAAGADINSADEFGNTPLSLARTTRNSAMVKLLVGSGTAR